MKKWKWEERGRKYIKILYEVYEYKKIIYGNWDM